MIKKAFFCIVICAIIAGANGILVKYMSSMSIGIIAWFRAVVPVILVLPYVYKRKNILVKNNYKKMLFISLLCAARMYMYLFAFKYTSVGNAVILALISAIIYAIIVYMFKTEIKKYDENQLVFYQNIFCAIFFIPFLVDLPVVNIVDVGIAVVNGFLIGIVVFKLFFFGLKHIHPITVSSLMYLQVVSSIVLSYFIFNENLGWHTLLGGSLIILSGFLLSFVKPSQT